MLEESMGAIIYWGILRFALVLIVCWALFDLMPGQAEWWSLFFIAVSVVVIYPAQIAYRNYENTVKGASQNGLCASCRYYSPNETLCSRLDEHVQIDYTPCGGEGWEPG